MSWQEIAELTRIIFHVDTQSETCAVSVIFVSIEREKKEEERSKWKSARQKKNKSVSSIFVYRIMLEWFNPCCTFSFIYLFISGHAYHGSPLLPGNSEKYVIHYHCSLSLGCYPFTTELLSLFWSAKPASKNIRSPARFEPTYSYENL